MKKWEIDMGTTREALVDWVECWERHQEKCSPVARLTFPGGSILCLTITLLISKEILLSSHDHNNKEDKNLCGFFSSRLMPAVQVAQSILEGQGFRVTVDLDH